LTVANIPLGAAYSGAAIAENTNVGLYGSVAPGLIISPWVLDITLNVSVTVAIAVRLWWMGQTMASLTSTPTTRFTLSIYVVVESGAIFAGANIIALVLYASNNPGFSIGVDITSQVAVCVTSIISSPLCTELFRFGRH